MAHVPVSTRLTNVMTRTFIFKAVRNALLVLVVVYLGVCSCAEWRAYRERKDADRLIVELRGLRVGESTLDDAKAIAIHHGAYRRSLLKPEPPSCDDSGDKDEPCFFDFGYENSLLARLGLATKVLFGVRVQIYQGRVDRISMDLLCGAEPNVFGVTVQEQIQPSTEYTATPFSNRPSVLWVRLTPRAPERARAYSLSLKCFDHIGRCNSKAELLPAVH